MEARKAIPLTSAPLANEVAVLETIRDKDATTALLLDEGNLRICLLDQLESSPRFFDQVAHL